jgi:N-acetylglucosamine malate deacetylase 2
MKPLVCVFAHPDDEAFGPAGTIAKFAKDRDVYLICVTSGNKGQNALKTEQPISLIREHELLESAQILGIKTVEFLDYDDGSLNNNLYHEVALKLTEKLQKYQPDTLLTYDLTGISGHLDHIAVSLITSFVFKKLDFIKELMYFCELDKVLNQMGDYFIFTPPGRKRSEIDLTIDITETWEQKVKAMRAHQSQKEDVEKVLQVLEKNPKENYFKVLNK